MKKISMKQVAFILLICLLTVTLTGCGSGNSLAKVQKKGELTVATSPDFPPFESLENNEIVGIEVDILNLIGEELGVKVVFKQMDFDSVLPGIQAGKFDVGMSGITVTDARKKNADFTAPYFMASQAIVVTPDSAITCKDDLTGKKISVQTGTTAEEYCMSCGYEVQAYVANNDAAAALSSGKVDAWVVDNEVAVALASEQGLVVLDEAMTQEPYAFAFAKGSDTLVKAFDDALAKMIADGTVQGIFDKYQIPYVQPK